MKFKQVLAGAALAATVAVSGGAQAAGFDQADLIKEIDRPLTVVFVPKVVHPWYEVVEAGAQFAADEFKKAGIEVNVIMDAPPVADISEHIRKIEANISRRPDGLAVACLDPATDTQAINDGIAAGVNVSTFDTDCPDSDRLMYVGHNKDEQDGYDLGTLMAERIGGEGKVGILSGSLSAPNHRNRVIGFKKAMDEYPDIEIVFERPDNDDLQKAVELTENALQANPDLDGIFGCNASAPIGAARAVKTAGKAGEVHVVGTDDLPEAVDLVKEGVIDALMAQRQWEIGYWTVKYFVAMAQGHTYPKEHATGSQFLTKDMVEGQ
ncbi:sugar ABC transporter substrate-binding protein [Roseospira marina]|uniref:Sugar ABC transporter substrate-binding protein n=1 Tax=Roseospira marina TaxID=140057 RepID=A0A5M6IC72_9PROT|nr:substrate-binding domain-containing protein [Roseospira marina]KAA5605335.1 sugar ABC transporter substrate-binding protein [Roseospira marina]MBB4314808.1 ribose transport system substrate-binding protein [Roseospira marina]MBB5087797.1 ribose transport system substrate-binding protein [Roseospira marina]